ncbi:hypothetical protein [Kitasatospora sp. LaBMicrA B282]|uniref:hypothetical protein n=1 Tax=Kitasatospora sp. LaBMicrA B282 TaxID=3420949 RepID=UPI003D0B85AE
MKKLAMTTRVVTALAIAGVASLAGIGSASASAGGGCRDWANPVPNVYVRPCISAGGSSINASLYLDGSRPLYAAWLNLYKQNSSGGWDYQDQRWTYCDNLAAGSCTGLDNVSFEGYPPGTYYVQENFVTSDNLMSGGDESPVLYLSY